MSQSDLAGSSHGILTDPSNSNRYSRHFMGRGICVVFLFVFSSSNLFGQAWTRSKGSSYTKLSYGAASASEQYSFDGTVKDYADNVTENAFFDRSLYLYTEYGLTDRITFVATLPYKRVIIRDASFKYKAAGLGSINLGIRHNLNGLIGWDNSANTLSINLSGALPAGYHRNYTPSVGAGQVDVGLGLNYGRSFYPAPAYGQAGLGYKYRSSSFGLSKAIPCQEGSSIGCFNDNQPDFSDELFFSAETGYTIAKRHLLQLLFSGTWSTTKPVTGFSVTNPIPAEQRYIKTGAGLRSEITKNMGLSGQVFWTAYGRNTVKSVDIFLGIDFQF